MRGSLTRRRWLAAGAASVIVGGLALTLLLAAFDRFTIEGSVRPVLPLMTTGGQKFHLITPYGRRHLLLLFLVSCPHCHEALDHVRRLRPWLTSCDVFAVSLSGPVATAGFSAAEEFPFPVWLIAAEEALLLLGVRRVPTMLFVSETDRVDWVHTGARPFLEDSVMMIRYCNGGSLGLSAVDSLGEDGSPAALGGASGRAEITDKDARQRQRRFLSAEPHDGVRRRSLVGPGGR